ncbi:MAG: S16 family serine protease [Euryarchaeota archaeon]|nr:S16 family serine protease [Euryarchaeota archaeon]
MEKKPLILIFLLLLYVSCASAAPVSVSLPAVYSTSEGEVGVLTNLTVWVTNGTGHVFVDTEPYTQVDMQGSARLSSMAAYDITSISPETHDLFYVVRTESPVIGGPSAGAAMTVATVATLMNWTVDPGVVMTGMINPDGSIGAVGGIPAKLNVSAKNGAHTFLIPSGQGNITKRVRVVKQKGPFIRITEKPVIVNVIELGKEQGVQVTEIDDIRDAIYVCTGHEIPRTLLTGEVQTREYIDAMQPLAAALLDESKEQYNETDAIVNPRFKDALIREIQAIEDAQHDYDVENYYASMSRSFNTMINLRRIRWYSEYIDSSDKNGYLLDLVSCVEDEIHDAELDVETAKSKNGVLEGIGAAESRLTIAREKLDDAREAGDAGDAIDLLAFAMERARSARWWATLSCVGAGTAIPDDVLCDRAGRYYSQSASMLAYADALISEAGGSTSLLRSAADDLSRARTELQTGYYAGAIYDSLHAMVQAGTAIELIGITDMDEKVNKSERDAMSSIISARECGAEPILAVSAYEHAKTLASSQIDQIVDYGYAKMVARTAQSFAGQGNRTVVQETNISESIQRIVQVPMRSETVNKQPPETPDLRGYELLAVVAVVYFIRRRNR